MKRSFLDFNLLAFQELMGLWGEPRYRGKQICHRIYQQFINNPHEIGNLPHKLRERLSNELDWTLPKLVERLDSKDGSTKLLLATNRGQIFETVVMRYENRTSLCVSSQVGCKLACDFCQTGKLGFFAHLSKSLILAQVLIANRLLVQEKRKVTHIVFMGMGEPLDNYQNCIDAANWMMDPDGFHLSWRHVTISTSGLAPAISRFAEECKASLAVSLHAACNELRSKLMPINKKFPLARLKQEMVSYQSRTGKLITIEYILIKDVNCSIGAAKLLVKFVHGLRVKVNLIPFNAHPGLPYQSPLPETIRAFQRYLGVRSIPSPVRYSKGQDVSAACGQLAAKSQQRLDLAPERKMVLTEIG